MFWKNYIQRSWEFTHIWRSLDKLLAVKNNRSQWCRYRLAICSRPDEPFYSNSNVCLWMEIIVPSLILRRTPFWELLTGFPPLSYKRILHSQRLIDFIHHAIWQSNLSLAQLWILNRIIITLIRPVKYREGISGLSGLN